MQNHDFDTRTRQGSAYLNLRQAASHLGISERTFHTLRSRGMVPEPLALGPRALRWHRDELDAAVLQRAPRGGFPEPVQLQAERQARKGSADGSAR